MTLTLGISPRGHVHLEEGTEGTGPALSGATAARVRAAFAAGPGELLLHLATVELQTALPAGLAYARELGRQYLSVLCAAPLGEDGTPVATPPPDEGELGFLVLRAPPLTGLEYLNAQALAEWWTQLDEHVRARAASGGGMRAFLEQCNPLWRLVGQVTLHLAENKRDPQHPFAFLATYATRLSEHGKVQHLPLARALQEYAGAKNRAGLVKLLTPIERAAQTCGWVKDLVEGGGLYQALAWSGRQAYQFLQDIPALEGAGLMVRVPDWWKRQQGPRAQVSVRLGEKRRTTLGAEAMLDFAVGVTIDGEPLSEGELQKLLASAGGLMRLRGRWVEVNGEKLAEALAHWKKVERQAEAGEISFFEGMRLLAGAALPGDEAAQLDATTREWTGIAAGQWLTERLAELRDPPAPAPGAGAGTPLPELRATLRPYQEVGVQWLRFMTGLGLGACLADDMGLGKTIQVLGLLAQRRREGTGRAASLVVAPASLLANWRAEIERFTDLKVRVLHPSEDGMEEFKADKVEAMLADVDLAVTTYGMVTRMEVLRKRRWNLVILDEAQAIKNPGAKQTRAVKELQSSGRIALTGTPVENRLGDLWSLFDFLNPGLLGHAKAFSGFVKSMSATTPPDFSALRRLVQPYLLRRLKTDKRVITDLPEKTEVKAYCGLTRTQAALYEQAVRELDEQLREVDGIQRRGLVLAFLMRFKQICNHPAHWRGDGDYAAEHSGKFQRLAGLCDELAQRQEKALVFTQFREMAQPLADHLQGVYGRAGLVLHGGTEVSKRRELVEAFQQEDGPPFFVLSLKAGGTGLNLTAANHVIHFDRWWNPAVENQATDRAFRIGQKRNVMVHKFICRGTVEEKIDELIAGKRELAEGVLQGGGEQLLTELNDRDLLNLVALDIHKAVDA